MVYHEPYTLEEDDADRRALWLNLACLAVAYFVGYLLGKFGAHP